MQPKYQFLAAVSNFGRRLDLAMATVIDQDGSYGTAQPVQFVKRSQEEEGTYVPPMLSMAMTDGQNLMDELWRCGLRPSQGSGSAGALAATERHLADLQKLVFKDRPAP